MVTSIKINRFKKMEDIELQFKGVNVVSGVNGTCKTSILQIISNSYQSVKSTSDWVKSDVIDIIRNTNNMMNPKIESLSRGDKIESNPAPGYRGTLYEVFYQNNSICFRRHSSTKYQRYSLKPYYGNNKFETLPMLPVIYLGITRLYPYGEFQDDKNIKTTNKKLPSQYMDEIKELYFNLTGIKIADVKTQKLRDVKVRSDFSSEKSYVDSNTISAGEDNLYIILHALVSLKYYFEESKKGNLDIESILLIDELDATLHPSLQIKLLDLFNKYSDNYKIQVVITTHSFDIIKYSLEEKINTIYLIKPGDKVKVLENPSLLRIRCYLNNEMYGTLPRDVKIPVMLEDQEAVDFFNELCAFKKESNKVISYFVPIGIKAGCGTIHEIFFNDCISKQMSGVFAVLDGDSEDKVDLKHYIMKLPGKYSPEITLFEYLKKKYNDSDFWSTNEALEGCITQDLARDILCNIDEEFQKIENKSKHGESVEGIRREKCKRIYSNNKVFFKFLLRQWVLDADNATEVEKFFIDLKKMFCKVSPVYNLSNDDWM